jgi:dienelactone hydrolase
VLAPGRAERLIDRYAGATTVVIGGHSLGGAMAARFANRLPGRVDGLVLMGAFSAQGDDLSGADLEALVLAAEHDGLATLEEVRQGLSRVPVGTQLTVVHGAVHAFFGRYGPQRGDGVPTVERSAAEAQIAVSIGSFLVDVTARAQP